MLFADPYSTGISIAAGGGTDTLVLSPSDWRRFHLTSDSIYSLDAASTRSVPPPPATFRSKLRSSPELRSSIQATSTATPSPVMFLLGRGSSFDFTDKVVVGFRSIHVCADNQVLTFNHKADCVAGRRKVCGRRTGCPDGGRQIYRRRSPEAHRRRRRLHHRWFRHDGQPEADRRGPRRRRASGYGDEKVLLDQGAQFTLSDVDAITRLRFLFD